MTRARPLRRRTYSTWVSCQCSVVVNFECDGMVRVVRPFEVGVGKRMCTSPEGRTRKMEGSEAVLVRGIFGVAKTLS